MDDVYRVEKILNKRVRNGAIEYLIKWSGWKSCHNTWEPQQNILDLQLISNYQEQQKNLLKRNLKRKMRGEINEINGQRIEKIAKISKNNMEVTIVKTFVNNNKQNVAVNEKVNSDTDTTFTPSDATKEINPFKLNFNISADLRELNIIITFNRASMPGAADQQIINLRRSNIGSISTSK